MDLQDQVAAGVQAAIAEAVQKHLVGYQTPFSRLVDQVVEARAAKLGSLIGDAVDAAVDADFRVALGIAVSAKLARVVVSKLESAIEKRASELLSSPELKAKMLLAIAEILRGVEGGGK